MKTFLASALLLLTVFLASCGTKTEVITNTYSGAEPGNIKGKVVLLDTVGGLIADASNVRVELEGTKYFTVTVTDGSWELKDIPAGTYPSLQYSRKNFPTFKLHQEPWGGGFGAYLVGGGGTQYDRQQDLYQISQVSVNIIIRDFENYTEFIARDTVINSVNRTVYDSIIIPKGRATFSSRVLDVPKNKEFNYYGGIFFGAQPLIDPTDPITFLYSTTMEDYLSQTDLTTGMCNFTINAATLKKTGFISGQTVYCLSFFGNRYLSENKYFDYENHLDIYPGFSPYHSEVKSFILP
jgi:hypothetical protein